MNLIAIELSKGRVFNLLFYMFQVLSKAKTLSYLINPKLESKTQFKCYKINCTLKKNDFHPCKTSIYEFCGCKIFCLFLVLIKLKYILFDPELDSVDFHTYMSLLHLSNCWLFSFYEFFLGDVGLKSPQIAKSCHNFSNWFNTPSSWIWQIVTKRKRILEHLS